LNDLKDQTAQSEMVKMMLITPQTTEAQLLEKAQELDRAALGEIHDRYYPEIFRFAFLRTGDQVMAEDIASEVFLRLLTALHNGRAPHTTLRGWLFGVASHLVTDNFRKRQPVALDETFADSHSTHGEAEDNILYSSVREAIKKLTSEQQEVLGLRFGGGSSVEETAKLMN
jgi:RNA polymerase sigma-70 factor (ECF subfamily)